MTIKRILALIFLAGLAPLIVALPRAQTEDVFAFIPPGGKTLLARVLKSGPPTADAEELLAGRRASGDWRDWLEARKSVAALGALDQWELATLADYLAANMPLPVKAPADPATADWGKILPPDGRDLALQNCQFCHIITVVVTQEKTRDAWLGTLNKPSHVEIPLSPAQREALAAYLVVNAAIPVDQIPEDLRAGGASY